MPAAKYRRWLPKERADVAEDLSWAITRQDEDETCEKYGLSRHQMDYYRKAPAPPPGRLRRRASKRPDLEKFLELLIARGARLSFSNALLIANVYAAVCAQRKVASSWISRFTKRQRLRRVVPHGERAASDVPAARQFVEAFTDVRRHPPLHSHTHQLPSRTLNITDNELCNADESALYFKRIPTAFLTAEKSKDIGGGKLPKARVTIMLTSFADGADVPLAIVGSAANPRCGRPDANAPVWYFCSSSAWMNSTLYGEFLERLVWWCRTSRKQQRMFLTVDNCASHLPPDGFVATTLRGGAHTIAANMRVYPATTLPSDRRFLPRCEVYLIFLPKNTTAVLQPMDRRLPP